MASVCWFAIYLHPVKVEPSSTNTLSSDAQSKLPCGARTDHRCAIVFELLVAGARVMLAICDSRRTIGRRSFLRIGSLGLGGLSLANLLATQQASAGDSARPLTGKSVIFLFLHGGPSQIETFDPKMDAPAGIRSVTGEIPTALNGITFGSSFPRLAKLADKLAIIRSFRTGDANHDIKPVVGKATLGANMGSLFSRVVGTNDPKSGMPLNGLLFRGQSIRKPALAAAASEIWRPRARWEVRTRHLSPAARAHCSKTWCSNSIRRAWMIAASSSAGSTEFAAISIAAARSANSTGLSSRQSKRS
jgi:hypothetical protein